MKQMTSPYLPGWEYIADGEPHVFGDRLYIFGSHDRFNGRTFCMNDYVCWSAPLADMADWRYEGVTYRKDQDPDNRFWKREMWAPDVCRGPDGRYYLYYCLANRPKIGVAVCDTPAGKYEFYGYVHDEKGGIIGKRPGDTRPFDPAVLVDDDGRIHLYAGQSPLDLRMAKRNKITHKYTYHMELKSDMLTVCSALTPVIPNVENSGGTGFEGHEFFEASSIRKFDGRYYFIYSSVQCHELCWGVSDRPEGGFRFGGALFSTHPRVQNSKHPAFTQDEPDGEGGKQYIANMRDGATAVFKYFRLDAPKRIRVTVRGKCSGVLWVKANEGVLAKLPVTGSKTWTEVSAPCQSASGHAALFFTYEGKGHLDFMSFTLED